MLSKSWGKQCQRLGVGVGKSIVIVVFVVVSKPGCPCPPIPRQHHGSEGSEEGVFMCAALASHWYTQKPGLKGAGWARRGRGPPPGAHVAFGARPGIVQTCQKMSAFLLPDSWHAPPQEVGKEATGAGSGRSLSPGGISPGPGDPLAQACTSVAGQHEECRGMPPGRLFTPATP